MVHLAGAFAGVVGGSVEVNLGNPPAAPLCLCMALDWLHTKEQT